MQTQPLRLFLLALSAVGVLIASSGPAGALPAPMSPKELEENSDVIATVKVLGVACTGHVEASKQQVLAYQAWLQVVKVKKGSVKSGETLLVQWHDLPKDLIGPWKVAYQPGEEVETHLKWDAKTRNYGTTWWNAKGQPIKPGEAPLQPMNPGDVIAAKRLERRELK